MMDDASRPKGKGFGTGRHPITAGVYTRILDGFREHGVNFTRVARYANVHERTARKAYETAWPKRRGMDVPIKDIIDAEMQAARANLATEQITAGVAKIITRDKVRQQAIESREQEGKLVNASRSAATQVMGSILRMGAGVNKLAERLNKELEAAAAGNQVNLTQMFTLLRRYASTVKDTNQAIRETMEMERLHLGEPTSIIGIQSDVDDMTMNECIEEINRAQKAVERAVEMGVVPPATDREDLN